MEEVDRIILTTLRQLGTTLADATTSIRDLTPNEFVEGCARCLNTINGNEEIPLVLPSVMAARFRHGTLLANACKSLGYHQEIGYNTFLYSNETECRNILMWLIDKLPKESATGGEETSGPNAALFRSISSEISRRLTSTWTPPFTKQGGVCRRGGHWHLEGARIVQGFAPSLLSLCDPTSATPARAKYLGAAQPLLPQQPPLGGVAASVVAHLGRVSAQQQRPVLTPADRAKRVAAIRAKVGERIKGALNRGAADPRKAVSLLDMLTALAGTGEPVKSSFRNKEQLQFATEDAAEPVRAVTEEELLRQREEEENALAASAAELDERIAAMRARIAAMIEAMAQARKMAATQGEENARLEEAQSVRRQVVDLLPNADENILKLQGIIDASAQRLLTLGTKWADHRRGLADELKQLKVAKSMAKSEAMGKLEACKALREEMKTVTEEARGREVLCRQLEEDLAKLPKDAGRDSYTARTMEIVRNIGRQKDDIAKVLIDTRALQKDISQLSDKLGRTFTVADELVFKDAKKDEACRKAYKLLAALHETCAALVAGVEATGATIRDAQGLEEQVEAEQRKNMAEKLKKVSADLKQLKADNAAAAAH